MRITDCITRVFLPSLIIILILIPLVMGLGTTSVGDSILKTDALRNRTGATGDGIAVGVISNGVKHLSEANKTGDLPVVHVLKEGQMDEGVAMLEIVHDIAPGARLFYDDYGGNEEKFNQAVDELVNAGCHIIVDDVGYLEVPYFEDGTISKHLNEVLTAHPNLLYISAAGNYADAHYQADFEDGGEGYHSFQGAKGIPVEIASGGSLLTILQWDDPFAHPEKAYSLELFDTRNNTILAMSESSPDKNLSLVKLVYQNLGDSSVPAEIRVRGENDAAGMIKMMIITGKEKPIDERYLTPNQSIIGQSSIERAISVAAISPEKIIEKFSSQGNVSIKYPNFEERRKPDITGIDNVAVSGAGGFPTPFTGTSAAAPHIAGLLALEWSLYPNMSADQMKDALFRTSQDLGQPGWDPVYGYGLPDALQMYAYLGNKTPEGGEKPEREEGSKPDTSGPIENGKIIGTCTISQPGYYELGRDIRDSSPVIIQITCSNVMLNGAGHELEGTAVRFGIESPIVQQGIRIESSTALNNITLKDMRITGTYAGISGVRTDGLHIEDCDLQYNTLGVHLNNSTKAVLTHSVMSGNGYCGLVLSGCTESLVDESDLHTNLYGIILQGGAKNNISLVRISGNHKDGLFLSETRENTITHTELFDNQNGGIGVYSSVKNLIQNNICRQNNPFGILLHESAENRIQENTLQGNTRGLNIYYSNANAVINNSIGLNTASGILIQPSGNNVLMHNRVYGNGDEGVLISYLVDRSAQNLITDNYFENQQNVRVQEGGAPNYVWNTEKTAGISIAGGPYLGGNVWAEKNLTGYSQVCTDTNGDGLCDLPYTTLPGVLDNLPLRYSGYVSGKQAREVSEPATAEEWIARGKGLMGKGEYDAAFTAFDQAISLSPSSYQAWRDKALCLSRMQRYDEALQTIDAILKLYPESVELWSTKGDIYLVDMQAYQDSIPIYEKALSLDAQDLHTLVNLAYALDKTGRSEEALALYQKATTINPSLTDAWNKAGNILTRAARSADAVLLYKKALAIDPRDASVWNNLGYALSLSGQNDEAISAYQNAVNIDPSYSTAWENMGSLYRQMGREEEATDAFSHFKS